MAIANITEYCMKMNIPEIGKLDAVYSPEISIHGIPWKVKVSKKKIDEQPWLAVHLFCANKDMSSNWSLWGSATFKLMSFDNKVDPVELHTPPLVFDRVGDGYGKPKFMHWNDLIDKAKSHVKNDAIKLEINVKAENPNDPNRSRLNFKCIDKCCDNGRLVNYHLTVTNVTNLMAVRSPKFKLRGLMWEIQISRANDSELSVLLQLKEDFKDVSCKRAVSIKLVSSKKDVPAIEKCDTAENHRSVDISVVKLISWDELMKPKNGFVNNDSITLEIELSTSTGTPENYDKNNVSNAKRAKLSSTNGAKYVQMECAICLEYIDNQDLASTPCGHLFCFECIKKAVGERGACPACTDPVQLDTLRRLYLPFVN